MSMKRSRPSQATLTANNDLSKTAETLAVVDAMVDGLNDHDIDTMDRFFSKSFRWIGNAGCGYKVGLNEFQENWQRPFQDAFSDKVCVDEARVTEGEWCSAFGRQEAVHSGDFMGIPATHKKLKFAIWIFGKWLMEKLLITGLWLIFHRYYSNLELTHSAAMGGKRWILKELLFKMAKSPNPP